MANLIRGAEALGRFFGVSRRTILKWKAEGRLAGAVLISTPRYVLYDADRALNALAGRQLVKAGRITSGELARIIETGEGLPEPRQLRKNP